MQDIRSLTVSKFLLETSGPFSGGFVVPGDARGRTKRGLHEFLTIRLPFLILLLERLKPRRQREFPIDPNARVFGFAAQTWRKKIHEMAASLGYPTWTLRLTICDMEELLRITSTMFCPLRIS